MIQQPFDASAINVIFTEIWWKVFLSTKKIDLSPIQLKTSV